MHYICYKHLMWIISFICTNNYNHAMRSLYRLIHTPPVWYIGTTFKEKRSRYKHLVKFSTVMINKMVKVYDVSGCQLMVLFLQLQASLVQYWHNVSQDIWSKYLVSFDTTYILEVSLNGPVTGIILILPGYKVLEMTIKTHLLSILVCQVHATDGHEWHSHPCPWRRNTFHGLTDWTHGELKTAFTKLSRHYSFLSGPETPLSSYSCWYSSSLQVIKASLL